MASSSGHNSGKRRTLSKSRFKTALECPTKLWYADRKSEYINLKDGDKFLEQLAMGGFQVGALAQAYRPDGVEVKTLSTEDAVRETAELLKRENVTIFEAAFLWNAPGGGDLLVRVDVIEKRGNKVKLMEVKAKSFDDDDLSDDKKFYDKRVKDGVKIKSKWLPYLYDVAYQTYVVRNAMPHWEVTPWLILANTGTVASEDGLNQRFLLVRDSKSSRKGVEVVGDVSLDALGDEILLDVDVSGEVKAILENTDKAAVDLPGGKLTFEERVRLYAQTYASDTKYAAEPSSTCKKCEFKVKQSECSAGKKSGFVECWTTKFHLKPGDLEVPTVLDIWQFQKSDDMLKIPRIFASQVPHEELLNKEERAEAQRQKDAKEGKAPPARKSRRKTEDGESAKKVKVPDPGFTRSGRQWEQVRKLAEGDTTPTVMISDLKSEMNSWKFPLHFIDFETSTVAIPFYAGMRPYETIAFQFSHHVLTEDGRIEHRGEWLCRERGKFPNFEFVKALKSQLEGDDGTIFRYHNHENTVLTGIRRQIRGPLGEKFLSASERTELVAFIESITHPTRDMAEAGDVWNPRRDMVDLFEVVKQFYYDPGMGGSISIKKVLPAVLRRCAGLQNKYNQPIYGSKGAGGITSLNFKEHAWIKLDAKGEVIDPYKSLGAFCDWDVEALDRMFGDEDVADGGAAMSAYWLMQFTKMTEAEAADLSAALLRYCELDTIAMVMLYEGLKELVAGAGEQKKVA